PDRPLNRLFLRSSANARRPYPIEPREVHWLTVGAAEFFSPLPGWSVAGRLARLDGSAPPEGDIELAERYYHLGVGVRGVLVARGRSIFGERPSAADEALLDVDLDLEERVLVELEALIADLEATSTNAVVRELGRVQVELQELRIRLRGMLRTPL